MSHSLPFDPEQLNLPRTWERRIPEDRLPILVTGVAGVVGFNVFHYLRHKYGDQVYGIRPHSNWKLTGPNIIGLDPEDRQQLRELFEQIPFRSVLSCGGSCALKSCELDPQMAQRVNVESIESLLDVTASSNVRVIHTSIDLVYSGNGGGTIVESLPTDPVSMYGKTMVQAEQLWSQHKPDSLILRISLPMGLSFNGHAGAIDWIQNRFAKGRPATLYYDEVRTPTYSYCMNQLLERTLTNNLSGIFHAGGPTQLSLYQIAQIINRVGGYDPDLLQGCHRMQAGPIPPRAGNVTMNSDRLRKEFGSDVFLPWPFDVNLMPTDRRWHYQRTEAGSPERVAEILYSIPGHFDGMHNKATTQEPLVPR